jgi:hypothetical protein
MKNKEPMILTEREADRVTLRAVLRDWGYGENAIHRVLTEHNIGPSRNDQRQKVDSIQRQSMSQQELAGEPSRLFENPVATSFADVSN